MFPHWQSTREEFIEWRKDNPSSKLKITAWPSQFNCGAYDAIRTASTVKYTRLTWNYLEAYIEVREKFIDARISWLGEPTAYYMGMLLPLQHAVPLFNIFKSRNPYIHL